MCCSGTDTSNGEFSERFSLGNAQGVSEFVKNMRDLEFKVCTSPTDLAPGFEGITTSNIHNC
jgi:hypothetical protein